MSKNFINFLPKPKKKIIDNLEASGGGGGNIADNMKIGG